MRLRLALLVVAATASRAAADDGPCVRSLLAEGGMFYGAGAGEMVGGVQAFLGVSGEPVALRVRGGRGFTALGARIQWGGVASEHELLRPSGADASMLALEPASAVRWTTGPELRAGVAWLGGAWPVYTFVATGPFWSSAWADDDAAPWIPEIGHRRGARGAVGLSVRHVLLEVAWEHVAATDRAVLSLRAAL